MANRCFLYNCLITFEAYGYGINIFGLFFLETPLCSWIKDSSVSLILDYIEILDKISDSGFFSDLYQFSVIGLHIQQ